MMNFDKARKTVLVGSLIGGGASLGGWTLRKAVDSKPWNVVGAVIEGLGSITVAVFGALAATVDIENAIMDIVDSEK